MCCSKKILRKDELTSGTKTLTFTDCGDGKIYLEHKEINLNTVFAQKFNQKGMRSVVTTYLEATGSWDDRYKLDYAPITIEPVAVVEEAKEEEPTASEENE